MGKRYLILSPHLDDAPLNCCDHILAWQKSGIDVTVVSVFTAYSGGLLSAYHKYYLDELGIPNLMEFELLRKAEDIRAMEELGLTWHHLNFLDASVRFKGQTNLYPDFASFTHGPLRLEDASIFECMAGQLSLWRDYDLVFVPFGVGGHVDHRIVRDCALPVFNKKQLGFYIEFNYALNPLKWQFKHWNLKLLSHPSFKFSSAYKRKAIQYYQSQIIFFSRFGRDFPELIFYKN